jgi:uncharacterized protein (DUF2252 family)
VKKRSVKQSLAPRQAMKSDATRAERKELGKLAREKCPLESHSKIHIPSTGRDVLKIIEQSNEGRIPELIPMRYERMLQSPFTFFRGSAALMAADLAQTHSSGIIVQACGDCHIQNFGAFATPERNIVVDINDFDETLPAPWEWDVKRLAASLVLAAMANGFDMEVGQEAAFATARRYRERMDELSKMSILDVWYSRVEIKRLLEETSAATSQRSKKALKEAIEKSTPEVVTEKLTTLSNGRLRFKDMPPLLCHLEGISAGETEKEAFEEYRKTLPEDRRVLLDKFEMVDIARKIVGIGSVGTVCGVILMVSSEQDILVLQLKEARPSVLEPYAGASKYAHHGQRIVNGQKLMQAASDMFLGWLTGPRKPHRHFFIRQLRDVKIGANTALWGKSDFKVMAEIAGEILARAHARSGDAALLRGYLGKTDAFDNAITSYATAYAKQTVRDHAQFLKACKSGRLKVQDLG